MTIDHDQLKADVDAGTPGLIQALMNYRAHDMDGVFCVVSRQAVTEAVALIIAATARADRAEAELAALRASMPDVLRAERERCAASADDHATGIVDPWAKRTIQWAAEAIRTMDDAS